MTSESTFGSPDAVRARGVLACMGVCTVLVVGFVASVNLAVPLLAGSDLRPSSAQLLWIVDAYVVFFACLVVPAGAAGDRYGRRGVLLGGLVLFAAGALVSALANAVPVLLFGRVVTGVGAACVLPNSLALLVHATPAPRRPRAIAVWASASGAGGVLGNVGGGALLTTGSWRWLFAAAVPIALVCAGWVGLTAPRTERHSRNLGLAAGLTLTAATLVLLFSIVQGPEHGWANVPDLGGFAASAVLFLAWSVVELRARQPLLDPRLFRSPVLRAVCLGMLVTFFGSYGLFYLNASLLQYGRGYSTWQAGLAVVPVTVPLVLGDRYMPALTARIGLPTALGAAFLLQGAALFGLAGTADAAYPAYSAWLVVFGAGLTLAVPCLTAEISGALPREQAGVGAGLQSTTRELGSALGVAVVGSLVTTHFVAHLAGAGQTVGQVPRTVAQALAAAAPQQHDAVLRAFTAGSAAALRTAGLTVLAIGTLVVAQVLRARRPASPAGRPSTTDGSTAALAPARPA